MWCSQRSRANRSILLNLLTQRSSNKNWTDDKKKESFYNVRIKKKKKKENYTIWELEETSASLNKTSNGQEFISHLLESACIKLQLFASELTKRSGEITNLDYVTRSEKKLDEEKSDA